MSRDAKGKGLLLTMLFWALALLVLLALLPSIYLFVLYCLVFGGLSFAIFIIPMLITFRLLCGRWPRSLIEIGKYYSSGSLREFLFPRKQVWMSLVMGVTWVALLLCLMRWLSPLLVRFL